MKTWMWLAIAVAIGACACHQHAVGGWPFASGGAKTEAVFPEPSNAPGARQAGAPGSSEARGIRSTASDWGGVADPQGILDRSETTPHLDGASNKARQAMRSMEAAQAHERATLGGQGQGQSSRDSRPAD
jgi:hypothetical protein